MADFDPTDYDGGQEDPLLEGGDADAPGEGVAQEEAQLRDAVLFVIDCSKEAFVPLKPGGRSLVGEALAAAASVMKTKVITAPDDKVGVAFYGVREKLNPNSFEGIRVLQDLDRPSAQRIRQLEQEAARQPAQFEERYGYGRPVPVSDVFWTCTTVFNLGAHENKYQGRVFLFTCNDSPCSTDAERTAAETRAQDLMEAGVSIEFFPFSSPEKPFDIDRFWSAVLPIDPTDYVSQAAMRLEELERRIRMRVHRKRTLQRLNFHISEGVDVSVSVFVTMLESKIPYPVYLLNENNKPLKSQTRQLCEQTGQILHPVDDIKTYVEVAGQRIFVSRAEVLEIKQLCEPGLRLLGFKSLSSLKHHHSIFHAYFVYPNDKGITGSSTFLSALLTGMLERRLIAIASYVARRNAEPVLVALLPQAEEEDGSEQLKPPGFHMIRLPWAEEIRQLSLQPPTDVPAEMPPELKEAAKKVVDSLTLEGFVPGCAENPVLQKHYAAVQALALGEEQPEETVDVLQPDAETLATKAPIIEAWKAAIDAIVPPKAAGAGAKRALEGEDGLPKAKAKREAPPAPLNMDEMRNLVNTGEVDRLTVPQLKEWLKVQGVANSGKKSELLDRVKSIV
eukprot:TRINITY_DN108705_c0_g1_i1.p1 TRINITY_DN108705_c0_g1~~TRINITY_DN108705_c0_g1_i1.p1  ORF type:complete len:632 (-),score=135.40 TRINITY_DN108705_c0_g1_i1:409-2265(-)